MASTTTNLGLPLDEEEKPKEKNDKTDEPVFDESTGKKIVEPKVNYPKVVG